MDIESIFLSLLGSPDKLRWYLTNNIDTIKYIYQTSPYPMAVVDMTLAFVPTSTRRELLKDFNVNKILLLLKKERPDIYNILISHPNGRRWLEDQIQGFKGKFW